MDICTSYCTMDAMFMHIVSTLLEYYLSFSILCRKLILYSLYCILRTVIQLFSYHLLGWIRTDVIPGKAKKRRCYKPSYYVVLWLQKGSCKKTNFSIEPCISFMKYSLTVAVSFFFLSFVLYSCIYIYTHT